MQPKVSASDFYSRLFLFSKDEKKAPNIKINVHCGGIRLVYSGMSFQMMSLVFGTFSD